MTSIRTNATRGNNVVKVGRYCIWPNICESRYAFLLAAFFIKQSKSFMHHQSSFEPSGKSSNKLFHPHCQGLHLVSTSTTNHGVEPNEKNCRCRSHHHAAKGRNIYRRNHNGSPLLSRSFALHALVPLSVEDMDRLLVVSGAPTGEQSATYWGRTQRERYGRIFESSVVTILGVIFSYCLSFVLGGFVATILGSVFLFWSVFSPQLQAYQRNWELRGGRDLVDPWIVAEEASYFNGGDESKQGLYGALFLGHIEDVCVVEEASVPAEDEFELADFKDYNMATDELERWAGTPYLLRVKAEDREGRTLQVHARMSEEYVDLKAGQPVLGVMLSTSQSFTTLAALTDLYVPDLECWIGDYPYLDRAETEQLLANDDEIWEILQNQRQHDGNTISD